jgi:hypothetical protein
MNEEDYLWDRSGEARGEIAQLEEMLGELRWSGKRPELPDERRYKARAWVWATAAALLIGAGLLMQLKRAPQPVTSWQLSLAGAQASAVRSGQTIETGAGGATMESELVGQVEIDPNSRLRMPPTSQDQNRLALEHGTIHAFIWAPPTKFVVDTPAAKAVDLGCQYTLSVSKDGEGYLSVEMGWVAFQWKAVESFIPEGAACTTRPGHGPDTPYFLDAPAVLTKSLAEFDRTGHGLQPVLAAARPRDALTLWHLLARTKGQERAQVFERFAQLVNLPSGVTREGVLRGDRASLDGAWDALQLGNTSWWREWKRNW